MSDHYNYDPPRRNPADLIDHFITALVIVAALSIPALGFAAWYFENGNIAWWAVIPFIFFMAG